MDTNYEHKYLKYKAKYHNFKQGGQQHNHNHNHNQGLVLGVRDPWLFYIQTGRKTVEGRLGDSNKYRDWIGKTIKFVNKTRMFPVKVVTVRHYDTLKDYLDKEGYDRVLPGITSYEEAIKTYHGFYSDERIKEKGGMVDIEIMLV